MAELAVLLDPIDHDLKTMNWWTTQGYATRWFGRKFTYLHRLVLERKLGRSLLRSEVTDHANGNKLDNRRSNLRAASPSQSMMNRRKQVGTSSRFIGVSLVPFRASRNRRWKAYVKVNGRQVTVGYFWTEEEAARARDLTAKHYYGEYAVLNNV